LENAFECGKMSRVRVGQEKNVGKCGEVYENVGKCTKKTQNLEKT
jgi:hypothetical protein